MILGARAGAPASASAAAAVWAISSASSPTNFAAGDETGDDTYILTVVDSGEGSANASPIEVADTLPGGLVANAISGRDIGNGQALSCTLTPRLGCSYTGFEVAPGDVLQIELRVNVSAGAPASVVNSATVSGGGAEADASTEDPTTISSTPAGFGISQFRATWSGTQGGASVNLTAGFTLNDVLRSGEYQPAASPKEVALELPSGVVANATAIPRCSSAELDAGSCEEQTAVGVLFASLSSSVGAPPTPYSSLLYNVAPEPGELSAYAFRFAGGWVRVQGSISAEDAYRMSLRVQNLPEAAGLLSMQMTLWGVPGAYNNEQAGPDHVLAEPERDFGPPGAGGTPSATA